MFRCQNFKLLLNRRRELLFNWTNKKVLITGGAGFIGSHLVYALLQKQACVSIVDLRDRNKACNLEGMLAQTEYHQGDIAEKETLQSLASDVDCIFHLAGIASANDCEALPEAAFGSQVIGTWNVLQWAHAHKVRRVVFTSSAYLYGDPDYLPVDEKHPIRPLASVYNITKKHGEDICEFFINHYNLSIVILRLFNAFGPRQRGDFFIPSLILQALKSGKAELWSDRPSRDFTFVFDTVRGLIAAGEVEKYVNPINVGSGVERFVKDIAKEVCKHLNSKVVFLDKHPIGPSRSRCDNTRAKDVLGWQPVYSFECGLEETVRWYQAYCLQLEDVKIAAAGR